MAFSAMDDLIFVIGQTIKKLKNMERIEATSEESSSGFSARSLNIFASRHRSPQQLLALQYDCLLTETQRTFDALNAQVGVVLQLISDIEGSLRSIHLISRHDDAEVDGALREVHERFWTMFGFYKRELGGLKAKAQTIQVVLSKKEDARKIYTSAGHTLGLMNSELINLRRKMQMKLLSFGPLRQEIQDHVGELARTVETLRKKHNYLKGVKGKQLLHPKHIRIINSRNAKWNASAFLFVGAGLLNFFILSMRFPNA